MGVEGDGMWCGAAGAISSGGISTVTTVGRFGSLTRLCHCYSRFRSTPQRHRLLLAATMTGVAMRSRPAHHRLPLLQQLLPLLLLLALACSGCVLVTAQADA